MIVVVYRPGVGVRVAGGRSGGGGGGGGGMHQVVSMRRVRDAWMGFCYSAGPWKGLLGAGTVVRHSPGEKASECGGPHL